jgi:hypothetical protein
MGNNRYSMNINEKFLKRNFNGSLKGRTNNLDTKERDYMISAAMQRLRVEARWHDAVAKGACYLDGTRFWELVDIASTKKSPAHYFVACIGRECQ